MNIHPPFSKYISNLTSTKAELTMRLVSIFSVILLFTCGASADNLRRVLTPMKLSTSDCNHPSGFLVLAEDGLCDFPFIITGFDVDGLPPPAVEAHRKNGLNTGVLNIGVFRVSEDDMTCNAIVKSYIFSGKGVKFATTEVGLNYIGNFVVFRPPGQTSYVEEFPDQVGGLWATSGKLVFEGDDFIIRSYSGKKPFDICAYLE